ncbi:MAG: polysaccharide deacetylase family protein [Clostridiales bacterium]|nr:polysaccharide deacetylase family protein [Clostridiales bacterium]MCF8022830.1 polysaccharide deacetylase family protein [Clostridiales bacterium]
MGLQDRRKLLFLIIFIGIAVSIVNYFTGEESDGGGVVILTYHDIVTGKPQSSAQINAADFKEQVKYLYKKGYNVLSLDEFINYYNQGSFPEKSVMITFDDGYRSFYTRAYPILLKYNFHAVIFPVVGSIPGLKKDKTWNPHLSFHEMRLMIKKSGLIDVGSHTFSLHNISSNGKVGIMRCQDESTPEYINRIRQDLRVSKNVLELETNLKINTIAWPYGKSTYLAEQISENLGYNVFFTVRPGVCTPKTSLRDVPRFIIEKGELSNFKKIIENPGLYAEKVESKT